MPSADSTDSTRMRIYVSIQSMGWVVSSVRTSNGIPLPPESSSIQPHTLST